MSHAIHHITHGIHHIFHEVGHGVSHVFHEIKHHPSLLLAPVAGLGIASAAGLSLPGILGSVGSSVESIGSDILKPVGSLVGLTEGTSASGLFSSSTLGTIEKTAKLASLAGMFAEHINVPKPPSATDYFKSADLNFKPPNISINDTNLSAPNPFKFLGLKEPKSMSMGNVSLIEKPNRCGPLLRCG